MANVMLGVGGAVTSLGPQAVVWLQAVVTGF
jgi:hypothetical protein